MADAYVSDTGPFVIVPEWVISLPISHGAFRMYALISRYADYNTGEAFPSRQTLADRLGVSTDTVDRWLRELVKHDALEVTRRRAGKINHTNLYRVIRAASGRNDAATPGRKDAATGGRKDAAQTRTIDRHPPTEIRAVFEAWLDSTGRDPERSRLDNKRRRLIVAALDNYALDDVIDAVTGWRHSAFHRGENDRRKVYNDLGLLLRDAEHIERFRDMARTTTVNPSTRQLRPYDMVRPEPCDKCEDGWVMHEDEQGRSSAELCACQKGTR